MRRAVALLLACCSAPEERWLQFPPNDDAKALVLAAEVDGAIAHAEAYDVDPKPTALGFGLALTDEAQLHGLVYFESLQELGIDPGPLESVPAPEGEHLPAADALYVAAIADESAMWAREMASSAVDGFTARYRAPNIPPCTEFISRVATITSTSQLQFSVAIDDDSILIGSEDGELFVMTSSSIETVVSSPVTPDAAVQDPAGGLLFAQRNQIWKGSVIPPATVVAEPIVTAPGIGRFQVITGRTEPIEIFAIMRDGRFVRFDDDGPSLLFQFNGENNDFGVASRARGEAVAAGQQPDAVHYRGGVVDTELTPFPADSLLTVAHVTELGYVAGTSAGQIMRYTDVRWDSMGATGFTLPIRVIAPYPRGFVYAGANGGVGQYVEGRGFCDPLFPVAGANHGIHTLGDKVVVLQKYLMNGIAILEPND